MTNKDVMYFQDEKLNNFGAHKNKMAITMNTKTENHDRCTWATTDPLYMNYHDTEWGVPIFDDRLLFEFLILEGAQAGLSWLTILRKRENYRSCFYHFDIKKVAQIKAHEIESLLKNPGIIRNRLKIEACVNNAKAALKIQQEHSSLTQYLWQFVDSKPLQNSWQTAADVPTSSKESAAMSLALKQCGFKFVGPTICYAFMQAVGMVNDHTMDCFRHRQCNGKNIKL